MVDETENTPTESEEAPVDKDALIETLRAEITSLRKDKNKLDQAQAQARLEAKNAAQARAAELAEQGEYKKLLSETQQMLSAKEEEAAKAAEYLSVIREANKVSLSKIPENMRAVYETMDPIELHKHMPTIIESHRSPSAPNTGAGVIGSSGSDVQLTPAQAEIARDFNMKPEEYLASLRKHGMIE